MGMAVNNVSLFIELFEKLDVELARAYVSRIRYCSRIKYQSHNIKTLAGELFNISDMNSNIYIL